MTRPKMANGVIDQLRQAVAAAEAEFKQLDAALSEWWRAATTLFQADEVEDEDESKRLAAEGYHALYELKRGRGWCDQPPCAVEIQDRTIRTLEGRVRDLEDCLRQSFVLLERLAADCGGDDVGCQLD